MGDIKSFLIRKIYRYLNHNNSELFKRIIPEANFFALLIEQKEQKLKLSTLYKIYRLLAIIFIRLEVLKFMIKVDQGWPNI